MSTTGAASSEPAKSLLGLVACRLIEKELDGRTGSDAYTKLAMCNLGVADMIEIACTVADDAGLGPMVEVALPRYQFEGFPELSAEMLTAESSTELRTAPCSKEARLYTLIDESQKQSNDQVTKVDKTFLLDPSTAPVWVDAALERYSTSLPERPRDIAKAALKGILQADQCTLRQIVTFLNKIGRSAQYSAPPLESVGAAFWTLGLPSFPGIYESIPESKRSQPFAWKVKFKSHSATQFYLKKYNRQQQPITRKYFETNLQELQQTLDPRTLEVLRQFTYAPDDDLAAIEAVAKEDWAQIRAFFESAKRESVATIGELTRQYFVTLKDKTPLSEEDSEFIERLVKLGARPQKEDATGAEEFYERHHEEILQEKKLAGEWDKFIFGTEVSCTDFRIGLVQCLARLRNLRRNIAGPAVLHIKADQWERKDYSKKSQQACRYFEKAYRGLQTALGGLVEFDNVRVFDYDDVLTGFLEKKKERPPETSTAKAANQLTFRVTVGEKGTEVGFSGALKLVWNFERNSILASFPDDVGYLVTLAEHFQMAPLIGMSAALGKAGKASAYEQLDLRDCANLQGNRPEGTRKSSKQPSGCLFVPFSGRAEKLWEHFATALGIAIEKKRITQPVSEELKNAFNGFCGSYLQAIDALNNSDWRNAVLDEQACKFGKLIEECSKVTSNDTRGSLLRPLLQIGLASVADNGHSKPLAIVCPWHPLRLQAIYGREIQLLANFADLLGREAPVFTDQEGRLHFRDVESLLRNPGTPEVSLVWQDNFPRLVAEATTYGDYSIVEPPVRDDASQFLTNENPAPTAKKIAEVIKSYLDLQPHERDNFSVVLYDCDSAGLPLAVVESIRAPDEDAEQDTTCQVILTHRNGGKLAQIYENIATKQSDDDAFHVSESTKNFMARVRINILVDKVALGSSKSGQPTDIAFCQDVISREAVIDYPEVPRGGGHTLPAGKLKAAHWSRRREMCPGDNESVVYLACPAQTEAGWQFLHAIALVEGAPFAGKVYGSGECLIPARKLLYDRPSTAEIFEQTHALANWVVNLDDLLDRRLLKHRDIKVIRYKQSASAGRNLIISSDAEDHLLQATLRQKLRPLMPSGSGEEDLKRLCQWFVSEANEISGNLVLRAAKRGANANELIGLVLSRYLVEHETGKRSVCILLDDYAEWLGQSEAHIADLLLITPSESSGGTPLVDIVVTEAKFVEWPSSAHAPTSAKQLRDSLKLFERALSAEKAPSDQELWLSRISDLLFEGLQESESPLPAADLRTAIREKRCGVYVRGSSHVFIHSPLERDDQGSAFTRIKDTLAGSQEIFSRANLRALIQRLVFPEAGTVPTDLRTQFFGRDFAQRKYFRIAGATGETGDDLPPPPTVPDGPETPPEAPPPPSAGGPGAQPTNPPSSSEGGGGTSERGPTSTPDGSADVTSDEFEPVPVATPPAQEAPATPPEPSVTPPPVAPVSPLDERIGAMIARYSSPEGADSEEERWLNEIAAKVRNALLSENFSAKLLEKRATPNAALLRFEGANSLRVKELEKYAIDFRTTYGVDILSIEPEVGAVALLVARPERKVLSLFDLWKGWHPDMARGNTKLLIAQKETDGKPLHLVPRIVPHSLVAGQTGSGKSILVKNLIASIAATNTPEQVEFVIVDPKGSLDFQFFRPLPHFSRPIIHLMDDSVAAFAELVGEMERRQPLFLEAETSNIDEYIEKTGRCLPRIWVVHDEYGDWMQIKEYKEQDAPHMNRLAQKGRASGIYLIFAAQRPDVSVFTPILRSNLGNRMVLKVDSAGTSEVSLGIKNMGAERLLSHGHMLAITAETNGSAAYCQVPFISDDHIREMVAAMARYYSAI